MKNIMAILCGIFMGGANVIPGVSGGTVAVVLGFYEELISRVSSFPKNLKNRNWKELKEDVIFLLPILLGLAIGVFLFAKLFTFLLANYYEITMYSFLGLIVGSIPSILKKSNLQKNSSFKIFIPMILSFALSLALSLMARNGGSSEIHVESVDFLLILLLFISGFLASGAMIVPGISGSYILVLMGLYSFIMDTVSNIFDFSVFFHNFSVLLPFGLGVLFGIFVIAKIMNVLLEKYHTETFLAVVGFILGSLPTLIVPILLDLNGILAVIFAVVLAIVSYLLLQLEK